MKKALTVPSSVSLARQDREIATLGLAQARADFLPQSAVSSTYAYNSPSRRDRSTFSYISLNGIRELTAYFHVFQEIDTSGRLRAEYARARAGQDVTSASLAIAQRELSRGVAAAYFRTLLARHLAAALQVSLTESESFDRRTTLLTAGGEAARADLVKASAQVAFLRQALGAAQLAASLANQELASFWTSDVNQPLDLVDTFEQPLPEPEPAAANGGAPFMRRIEFRLLDAQFRGFQAESRSARSNLYPRLNFSFQYGVDTISPAWQDRGYALVGSVTFPVFDWFKTHNLSRQSRARAEQVRDNRAIAERTFSREYRDALERTKQFYRQVELAKSQLTLGEEDLKLSRIRYEGGEGSALDVVTAQNQLAQARSNYYATIANYLTARVDLEVTSGR